MGLIVLWLDESFLYPCHPYECLIKAAEELMSMAVKWLLRRHVPKITLGFFEA